MFLIFTDRQRSCGEVPFSVVYVCHSVRMEVIVQDPVVQGLTLVPLPVQGTNLGLLCTGPSPSLYSPPAKYVPICSTWTSIYRDTAPRHIFKLVHCEARWLRLKCLLLCLFICCKNYVSMVCLTNIKQREIHHANLWGYFFLISLNQYNHKVSGHVVALTC